MVKRLEINDNTAEAVYYQFLHTATTLVEANKQFDAWAQKNGYGKLASVIYPALPEADKIRMQGFRWMKYAHAHGVNLHPRTDAERAITRKFLKKFEELDVQPARADAGIPSHYQTIIERPSRTIV
ncbi:MAG: hypothetical protein IKO65_06315 [Victivallales bacterium]|nr:hypothetical protein [Victivallales bacterium]